MKAARFHFSTNSSILWQFLTPYLAIILVAHASAVFVHYHSMRVMEREVNAVQLRSLEQTRDILDRRFNEIDLIATQLVNTPKVYSYQYVSAPFQETATYQTLDLSQSLHDYKLFNNFIFDYYIYYPRSDMVLSAGKAYTLDSFYATVYRYQDADVNAWRAELSGKVHRREVLPSRNMNIRGKTEPMLTYLQSIGMSGSARGVVAVLINQKQIDEMLQDRIGSAGGWAYVADRDGYLLTSVNTNDNEVLKPLAELAGQRGTVKRSINGRDLIITYTTSDVNGWTYVSAQPIHEAMNLVTYIRKAALTMIGLSLAAGAVAAIFFAYRSSRPLHALARDVLGRPGTGLTAVKEDVYSLISGAVNRLKEDNGELEKKISAHMPILHQSLFSHLLKGEFASERDMEWMLKHAGLDLNGTAYVVSVVQLKQAAVGGDCWKQLDKSRVFAKDVLQETISGKCYLFDLESDQIAVISIFDTPIDPDRKEELKRQLERAGAVLRGRWNVRLAMAAGNPCGSLTELARSCTEARKALYQAGFRAEEDGKLHWYEEHPQDKQTYAYSTETETRLMHLVKAGEMSETELLLRRLGQDVLANERTSLELARLFLSDLTVTYVKLIEQTNDADGRRMESVRSLLSQTEDPSFGPRHVFEQLLEEFMSLSREANERKRSRNERLKFRILEFVRREYADPELYLASVARHFGVSEVYLSHYFKEHTGETFSEHLERLRMEKARELIAEGLPVQEIAVKVGYHTANSFGRAFKRVHGLSASAFKQMNN